MPTDARLKKRYGQARFDPSKGQEHMTYREWMDRHPDLKEGPKSRDLYERRTGDAGGRGYQLRKPDYKTTSPDSPESQMSASERIAAMPPDMPPGPARKRGVAPPTSETTDIPRPTHERRPTPVGGTWDSFKTSHKGQDHATLAAKWLGANKKKLTPKVAGAVAKRRQAREAREAG